MSERIPAYSKFPYSVSLILICAFVFFATGLPEAYEQLVTIGKPALSDIAYSPDGRFLGTSTRSYVELLDAETLEPVKRFEGSGGELEFSPDGSLLATTQSEVGVRVWRVDSEALFADIPVTATVIKFSPDGRFLAYAYKDSVFLWDVEQKETVLELTGDPQPPFRSDAAQRVYGIAFHPDGKTLAVGSMRRTIALWDIEAGEIISYLETKYDMYPEYMSFSHDGDILTVVSRCTGGSECGVRVWNVATGDSHYLAGYFSDVAFTLDDQSILVGEGNGNLYIIDAETFSVEKKSALDLPFNPEYADNNDNLLESLSLRPDGRKLASSIEGSRICVWNTEAFSRQQNLYGYKQSYARAVYFPKLNRVVTGIYTNVLHFWDASTGELLDTKQFYTRIRNLKGSPDGKMIAVDVESTNQIWDAATAEQLYVFRVEGHTATKEIAFSPSGKYLASMGCGGTFIWDTETGEELTWTGENGRETNQIDTGWSDYPILVFTSDEKEIVAIPPDEGKTVFWDIGTGEPVHEVGYIGILANAGNDIAQPREVGGETEIRLLKSDKLVGRIPFRSGHPKYWESFWHEKFHPSGNVIALHRQGNYGEPGEYGLYNSHSGELLVTIPDVRDLEFTAGGDYIFIVDGERQLKLYRTSDIVGEPVPAVFSVEPQGKKITCFGQIKSGQIEQCQLLQNYPNPFNPETWIPYRQEGYDAVTISIYSQSGKLVRVISLGKKNPGAYLSKSEAAYWDGRDSFGERVASGIYFYSMQSGEYISTRKMIVIE